MAGLTLRNNMPFNMGLKIYKKLTDLFINFISGKEIWTDICIRKFLKMNKL
jgi:hypothetical protein